MMTTDKGRSVSARNQDHLTLDREIAEWREWWGELCEMGQPHFGEMGDRLLMFRDHLAEHFTDEESGGCLSVVMGLDAETVTRIAELQDEHREFLAELNQIIARLQSCHCGFDCWGSARLEFEDFLDRLHSHEEAEDALIEQFP